MITASGSGAPIEVAGLPRVPSFPLSSRTVHDGGTLPSAQRSRRFGVPGGLDRSPHLVWSAAPPTAKSFAVTMFDPDAPTGSGFWHWTLVDLPAGTRELREGAGDVTASPSTVARHLRNDAGFAGYLGAAPPPGGGRHRYVFAVHALDVERLDVPDDASPALAAFTIGTRLIARAILIASVAA